MKQFVECPGCGKPIIADVTPSGMTNVVGISPFAIYWDHKDCSNGMTMSSDEVNILKALSIRQPWAWLVVNGYKPLENRSTLKNFRGPFLIHASRHEWEFVPDFAWKILNENNIRFCDDTEKGGIIGYANITDSITESDSVWFTGPRAFVIDNPKPLDFTPCLGKLGFFIPKIN